MDLEYYFDNENDWLHIHIKPNDLIKGDVFMIESWLEGDIQFDGAYELNEFKEFMENPEAVEENFGGNACDVFTNKEFATIQWNWHDQVPDSCTYEGEAETGVIEYRFRAGEAALYREFIANTIGATAVNDIDTMARTNVCLLALCILFCTISPAQMAYRRMKTKWYELASDVRTQMKTDYWSHTAKMYAKDAVLLTMISAAAAVPFAVVYIWLSHFFYIPLGLLPDFYCFS